MKLVRMKALKPTRYRNRRLLAGEEFDAVPSSARLFTKLKRASPVEVVSPAVAAALARPSVSAAKSQPVPGAGHGSDFPALREEYERLAGTAPDQRWGRTRLAREISLLNDGAVAGQPPYDVHEDSPVNGDGE